jgi:hypothetical protein
MDVSGHNIKKTSLENLDFRAVQGEKQVVHQSMGRPPPAPNTQIG